MESNIARQHIAGVANRPQALPPTVCVDLLTQLAHVNVYDVRLRVEMVIPDIFKQHGSGNDLICMPHQIFEKLELAGLQHHQLVGTGDFVRKQIHMQAPCHKGGFRGARLGSPQKRIQPREKFTKGKGLGQLIVAPGFQAANALVDFAKRAQDQDGHCVSGLP
jgi:hypothetical protein